MKWAWSLFFLLLLASCGHRQDQRVTFILKGAFARHFLIERAGRVGERSVVVDSGIGRSQRDTFVISLPPSEPTVYFVRLQYKSYKIPFIHDSTGLTILYDYGKDHYSFENSPASSDWQRFQRVQDSIGAEMQKFGRLPEAAIRPHLDSLLQLRYTRNFHFADTTTNPALFLLAYKLVDFDRDYAGLEKFMQRAALRFPGHSGISELVKSTLDYVRIFSNPLKTGDQFPTLQLPDSAGRMITVAPEMKKYLLLDCWSSWCDSCRGFSEVKKKIYRRADTSKLAMISIAIDAEEEDWKKIIRQEAYPWPQLIDKKMWNGPAASTLRFDSLPYNFLVAPGGRIIGKAVPADSLLRILKENGILH